MGPADGAEPVHWKSGPVTAVLAPAPDLPAVYARAADIIEQLGWTQGTAQQGGIGEDGPVCLGYALNLAAGPDVDAVTQNRIAVGLRLPGVNHFSAIPEWNDADGRTVADVLATLHRAESRKDSA